MVTTYDKEPTIPIHGWEHNAWRGYQDIGLELRKHIKDNKKTVLTIESYPGVRVEEIVKGLTSFLGPFRLIVSEKAALDPKEIDDRIGKFLTDDRVFGYMFPFSIEEFYSPVKLAVLQNEIETVHEGVVVVIGFGASLITKGDLLVYADLARWEIQLRYRSQEFGNWLTNNHKEDLLLKYKRGYFIEWRVADKLKKLLLKDINFYLDTNAKDDPKMISCDALFAGFKQTVARPFRLVPYFDPGVWGGRWLEEKIGLKPTKNPYAWGFDGVPEENSVYLQYGMIRLELPSINLIFFEPKALLGEKVYSRFGAEFPIRFDFLDTMGGQHLSLQVHPTTDYIREKFGMTYTQDESYYFLDAESDATIYLGIKEDINPEAMLSDLERAQEGDFAFPAEKYINIMPAKKHDHFLIPAGTIHCSGANSMILEISATPYIFTFKLWDWDRLGLDGKPRPIHIKHGKHNIQWNRTAEWVEQNLVNRVVSLNKGEGWTEERTGLHEFEFIETHRHWFTKMVPHHTNGGVQVLNLIEGNEAVVESLTGDFEPFTIHYAETFIVPASVGAYTIRPCNENVDKPLATIKAFVKN